MFLRNISKVRASFPTKNGNIVVDNNELFPAEDIIDLKGLLLLGAVEIVEDEETKNEATNDNQEITEKDETVEYKVVKETKKPNKLNKGRGKKAE